MLSVQLDHYCLCEMVIAVKMKLLLISQYYLGVWKRVEKIKRER